MLTTMPLQNRHTASNIAEWLEEVVARFEIPPSNIIAIVHDNGANVVAAARILEEKNGWSIQALKRLSGLQDVSWNFFFKVS